MRRRSEAGEPTARNHHWSHSSIVGVDRCSALRVPRGAHHYGPRRATTTLSACWAAGELGTRGVEADAN